MVDFDQLRQELSEYIPEEVQERFTLDWPGKRESLHIANAPIAKTIRPIRSDSREFDSTKNLFIEGDNLDALKILQQSYLSTVRMIYIDPPYNTGNDFIYDDDFVDGHSGYLIASNQTDENGNKLVANTNSNGRFHSDWLSMMHSRLRLARNLLRENGLIFISIGDDEQANLKKLCDEIFGVSNFLGCACRVSKKANNKGKYWAPNFDYILTYAKDINQCEEFLGDIKHAKYNKMDTEGTRAGEKYQLVNLYQTSLDSRPNQRYFIEAPDGTLLIPPGNVFPDKREDGAKILPESNEDKIWRWSKKTYDNRRDEIVIKEVRSSNLIDADGNRVKWNVFTKTYLNDVVANSSVKPNSLIEDYINPESSRELHALSIPFSFAKPSSLIEYLCKISRVRNDDIVMDFFAGSGSTGHGVMKFNKNNGQQVRFFLVQLPEKLDPENKSQKLGHNFCKRHQLPTNIAELSKERLRRAGDKIRPSQSEGELDTGFRVLKIDTSNMVDTYYTPEQTDQGKLFDAIENVKPDRTNPEDLLFQVLSDWGVDLALPIRRDTIQDKTVFFVSEKPCDLIACFDHGVTEELVTELAQHQPMRVVFRDNGFVSDAMKINAEQIFRQISPTTDVKSI